MPISLNHKPSEKNHQKHSLKESVFIDTALKIQCHVVKNALLQTGRAGEIAAIYLGNDTYDCEVGVDERIDDGEDFWLDIFQFNYQLTVV